MIGGGSSSCPAAAVEDEAALLECAESDARPGPSLTGAARLGAADTAIAGKARDRGAQRQGELCARTQPGMSGDRPSMVTRRGGRLHSSAEPVEHRPAPLDLGLALDRGEFGALDADPGRDTLDRQAETAETTAQATLQIEEAKMEPCRSHHANARPSAWSGPDPLTATVGSVNDTYSGR